MQNSNYRPDIDGLRAIAVLLVIFDHAGFSIFSGGFVGVDVFFVISGFLITGIVLGKLDNGSFSFFDFYVKRAKRLLPALYAVILATIVAGYFIFIPSDYSVLAQSAISAVGFSSNMFFWLNTGGYFSQESALMPLLHIWSLSVEEQFYFLWPLVLLFIAMLKKPYLRMACIVIMLISSIVISQYLSQNNQAAAYFLLPSRAFELMCGAILSLLVGGGFLSPKTKLSINSMYVIGSLLIVIPAITYSNETIFPGYNALIPCIGAMVIIAAGSGNVESKAKNILSSRPMVLIGLASYSIYIWHWPVMAFTSYVGVDKTSIVKLSLIVLSLLSGFASWHFIEKRFRFSAAGKKTTVISCVSSSVLIASVALSVYHYNGIASRFPYSMLTQDQLTQERSRYWNGITTKQTRFDDAGKVRNTVVVGNSHAYDFSYALTENGYPGKIKLIETSFYCFNYSHDYVWASKKDECNKELNKVLTTKELTEADVIFLHDNYASEDLDGLNDMLLKIRILNKAPIYVVGPKMGFTESVLNISKDAQKNRKITTDSINKFSENYQDPTRYKYDADLKSFFKSRNFEGIYYISAVDVQCGSKRVCNILSDKGDYLYFDNSHFTLEGSREFGEKLKSKYKYIF